MQEEVELMSRGCKVFSRRQNLDYIPYEETDKYVKKIEANYNIYKLL